MTESSKTRLPDEIDGWLFDDFLGGRRSGQVYLVHEKDGKRRVGVMKIHRGPELKTSDKDFAREIAHLASETNRGFKTALLARGRYKDMGYFVMEKAEPLPDKDKYAVRDFYRHAREILAIIERAHRAGLLHGDIKPVHVLLLRGHAVLIDLGDMHTLDEFAQEHISVGTRPYKAPELLEGKTNTLATEIFAYTKTLSALCPDPAKAAFSAFFLKGLAPENERITNFAELRKLLKTCRTHDLRRRVISAAKWIAPALAAATLLGVTTLHFIGKSVHETNAREAEYKQANIGLRLAEAETKSGLKCYAVKEYDTALAHLNRAVRTEGYENAEAYGVLAECYTFGFGTQQDLHKGFFYARLAAKLGDTRGKEVLEQLKLRGITAPHPPKAANLEHSRSRQSGK